MKKVVSNSMVAHLWANQTQYEARNQNGSIYFEGNTIYSYGSHFPMAKIIGDTVLFTSQSYSNTTSAHLSLARNAIHHLNVIEAPDVSNSVASKKINLDYFKNLIPELSISYSRARTLHSQEWKLRELKSAVGTANVYAKFIKSKRRFAVPGVLECRKLTANSLKASKALAKKRKAEILKREKDLQDNLDKWVAGEKGFLGGFNQLPVKLRIEGDKIETSHGAECPLKFGKRAYLQARANRDNVKTWQTNGHSIRLGEFKIDSIDEHGTIKAGCHTIPFSETERIAVEAGWTK